MEDPEVWRWIWLGGAVVGVVGEMAAAGTFFLLPFGVGAAVAFALAFAGAPLVLQWLAFVAVSTVGVVATRPVARRLEAGSPTAGVGARRLMGEIATVLDDIPAGTHETGLVRVGREEWRAESRDGTPVPTGTSVRVIDVVGTRVVVWPVDELDPATGEHPDPRPDHKEPS
ncbi:MAG TPA: NfeD family protein [Acidimicrobiales bacterium]|nr:NfeD family protein [Acidimicrobiales bacterium]